MANPRIVIAGAGSIGCYVGGCLKLAGRDVALFARPRLVEEIAGHGLHLTDLDGRDRRLKPGGIEVRSEPDILAGADVVLVTVKSGATPEMGALIAARAPAGATVISLQNGVDNAAILAAALPGRAALAGMVPFNVVQNGQGHFHRGTEGGLIIDARAAALAPLLAVEGLGCSAEADMPGVMWGKLLLNLNNALNALAGVPLKQELSDPAWRRVLAACMAEALAAMAAGGIHPHKIGKAAPALIPWILRLPNPLFGWVAGSMLKIDPAARSSMWEDLAKGRLTEIDQLQGAVIALARKGGTTAPVNAQVLAAIRAAEAAGKGSPGLAPAALA